MKGYLFLALLCLACNVAGAQSKHPADSSAQAPFRESIKRQEAMRNKAEHDLKFLNRITEQLQQTEKLRKDYWTTLTSERRHAADSLDKIIARQVHVRDSVQRMFDLHLVLLDSLTGVVNDPAKKNGQ